MVTNLRIQSIPYWFNCRDCGESLFYEGNTRKTERRRKLGYCEYCVSTDRTKKRQVVAVDSVIKFDMDDLAKNYAPEQVAAIVEGIGKVLAAQHPKAK
jgi:hypothetical protein